MPVHLIVDEARAVSDDGRGERDVPLSRQALAVLREVWDLSHDNGLIFPSIRSAIRPLSENAMNSALRRSLF